MLGPVQIEFNQATEQTLEFRLAVFPRHDETPWLFVGTGRSPARRFQQTAQDFGFNCFRRESPKAAPFCKQGMNGIVATCFLISQNIRCRRFIRHWFSSSRLGARHWSGGASSKRKPIVEIFSWRSRTARPKRAPFQNPGL